MVERAWKTVSENVGSCLFRQYDARPNVFIYVLDTSPRGDAGFIREGIPVKLRPKKER
jgi:hypothetical protein